MMLRYALLLTLCATARFSSAQGIVTITDESGNVVNGTMVNGLRLHSDQPLNDGDILSVGGTHMRFEAL